MDVHQKQSKQDRLRSSRRLAEAHALAPQLGAALQVVHPTLFPIVPLIEVPTHQGCENLSFIATNQAGRLRYVVRLHEMPPLGLHGRNSLQAFEKERYISDRLKGHPLIAPTPPKPTGRLCITSDSGVMQTFAYFIQQELPHKNAREVTPQPSRKRLLFQLGRILTEVHKVEVVGYGSDFNAITSCFSHETFEEYLAQKIGSIESAQLSPQLTRWLVSRTESLTAIRPRPLLSHRDVLANPGNILVDERGEIRAIIDWEMASSGLAFHSEVASLMYTLWRNGQSNAEIEHDIRVFLEGYNISYRHYKQFYQPDVDTLVLLNGVSAIVKHTTLVRTGLESLQPWRAEFAKRAIKLCEMHFAQDRANQRRYRIAA